MGAVHTMQSIRGLKQQLIHLNQVNCGGSCIIKIGEDHDHWSDSCITEGQCDEVAESGIFQAN